MRTEWRMMTMGEVVDKLCILAVKCEKFEGTAKYDMVFDQWEFINTGFMNEVVPFLSPADVHKLGYLRDELYQGHLVQWDAENIRERLREGRDYARNIKKVKFGRPEKKVPEKLQKRIIHWYKIQKYGLSKISKLILIEDIKDYPYWIQKIYKNGFGKGENKFYLSPSRVRERLIS